MKKIFESLRDLCCDQKFIFSEGHFKLGQFGDKPTFSHFYCGHSKISDHQVIYLHGLGDHGFFPGFALFERLIKEKISFFSFDLPGHGPYSTSYLSDENLDNCFALALSSAQQFIQTPVKKISVIGHSLGGVVAFHEIAKGIYPVDKLVILASPLTIDASSKILINEILHFGHPDYWRQIMKNGLWPMLPAFSVFKRKKFPIRMLDSSQDYLSFGQRYFAKKSLNLKKITPLTQPVLAIYAHNDWIAPPAHGKIFLESCIHGRLEVLPANNHFNLNFSNAALGIILEFIK